jgi:GNAT superfamily N-acetyltransferase
VLHRRSHDGFYRAVAEGSRSATLLEAVGVQAIAVPARPWLGILNCVFAYESADAIEDALDWLASEYGRAGVSDWGVWVPEEDLATSALLAAQGFAARTTVVRMIGYVYESAIAPRRPVDFVANPTWEMVAHCNDRSYGIPPTQSMAAAFQDIADPSLRLFAARLDGEVVSALVSREQGGDCYLSFVATVPEAQGAGVGGELVRAAFRAGLSRGCRSASGESTPMAIGIYSGVGGRTLGRVSLWKRGERLPSAPASTRATRASPS